MTGAGNLAGVGGAATFQTPHGRQSRGLLPTLILLILACALILFMNQAFPLRDRLIYEYYFDSLDTCSGVACLLISDSVRSPIFLSILILGRRVGLSLDVVFSIISIISLVLFFVGVRASARRSDLVRLLLVSIALGPYLYLIQVKLFLAIGLYLFSLSRKGRFGQVTIAIASILTHESIVFFMVLDYLWKMRGIRIDLKTAALVLLAGCLLLVWLGDVANVFWSALSKVQQYNEYAATGEVPPLARVGPFSALFLLLGLIGLLKVQNRTGPPSGERIKEVLWMFLPWVALMIFASNALIAIRLAELALLHALLVAPVGRLPLGAIRLSLFLFALTFGGLTLVRDVLMA